MIDIIQVTLGAIILTFFAITRPAHHRCVVGAPEGIRPSGATRCLVPPPGRGDDECVRGYPCSFPATQRYWYPVQIYCLGSTRPIASYDGRTVGCQP